MTLREMVQQYRRGKDIVCDSAVEIADYMEDWFSSEACDGFILTFPRTPGSFEAFCAQVVPELQRRGLFRREYEGKTLRDHFRLQRPGNMHVG